MQVIVPMAGEGSRFKNEGYQTPKPLIPTYSIKLKEVVPMVQAAVMDIPSIHKDTRVFFIGRDFHLDSKIDKKLFESFPKSQFITLTELSEGQASTCYHAQPFVSQDEEVFICSCDTGMHLNETSFLKTKNAADVIVFTHRHHHFVEDSPESYGWVKTKDNDVATSVSVKKPISQNPLNDHAIVGNFWFKSFKIFEDCYKEMILNDDRINNEFYVDQILKYSINMGYNTKVFEIEKCLCWGTPAEYENYKNTFKYWKDFLEKEKIWKP